MYFYFFYINIMWSKVSIHDPLTSADLRSEGIDVAPGYVSTILITPMQEVMHESGV